MVKSMKKCRRKRSPCLNLNNVLKLEIISTVSIETSSYCCRWNWCVFCFFCFILVHPVYSKFWLCDYCKQRVEKCRCYLIYDKANGDVARLGWVGDAFNDDANFGKSVKPKQN